MNDNKRQESALPKTWSADRSGGVSPPSNDTQEKDADRKGRDEGVRPEDLDTENDQGAS